MIKCIKKIPREKYWDYFIVVARFLIGWTFIRYGYSKMIDGQFGITPLELATPIKDLNLFRISWYLFDHQPFKYFIGISQLICGSLLIINRTTIIGAFLFLPIVATILIIDLTVMPTGLAIGFAWRLSFYITLDLLILWHYREKMKLIWSAVWEKVNTKFKFPIWAYMISPIFVIALEIVGALPHMLINLIIHPSETLDTFERYINLVMEMITKISI